jgi:nitrite reductase/ring-hydroxylating ferredoxin subunit
VSETGDGGCEGACPLGGAVERREFLRNAVSSAWLAMGALALGATPSSAMTVSFASGTGARADKMYPIPATDGVVIDKDESVIIARFDGRVFAFSLACPHQNTALRWDNGNGRFQCPKHRSRYKPDGVFIDGRATRGMDRFAVKRDGDRIAVNLDALYREDENPAQWAAAVVLLSEK